MSCLLPFLKIGHTRLTFHRSGKKPNDSDLLNRICNGISKTRLHSFRKMLGMPSGPAPQPTSRPASAWEMSLKVTEMTSKVDCGAGIWGVWKLVEFNGLQTELKKLANNSSAPLALKQLRSPLNKSVGMVLLVRYALTVLKKLLRSCFNIFSIIEKYKSCAADILLLHENLSAEKIL